MAVWDLGPKRWEIVAAAAEIDEDTGAWMIDLSLLPSSFWTTVNATDGRDIRVTSSDGDTQLPCHIIGFVDSGTTGVGWLRVGAAVSASVDTSIYIYAGDTGATMPARDSTYGSENAYDANVAAAWWWDGDDTDATANGNDLTAVGTPVASAGPVSGLSGYTLDGTEYFTQATFTGIDSDALTWETWAYKTGTGNRYLGGAGTDFTVGNRRIRVYDESGGSAIRLLWYTTFSGAEARWRDEDSGGWPAGSTWAHLAITYDGSSTGNDPAMLRNGAASASVGELTAPTGTRSTGADSVVIGARNDYNTPWIGSVGPVLIHNVVRSANYLATMRNMILNPGDVYTIGAMEEEPSGSGETDYEEFTEAADVQVAGGDRACTNLTNFLTSLASAMTVDIPAGGYSRRIILDNPADNLDAVGSNVVTSIAVEVVATGEDGGSGSTERLIYDYEVRLVIGGTPVGDNKALLATQWTDDSGQVTRVYGGEGDDWGLSEGQRAGANFTAADFGVSLRYYNDSGSEAGLFSGYRVRVKLWYGTPPPPDATGDGSGVLSAIEGDGTAWSDAVADGSGVLSGIAGDGVASTGYNADGSGVLAGITGDGTAKTGVVADGSGILSGLAGDGVAWSDAVADGSGVLPGLTASGVAWSDAVADGSGVLPAIVGDGIGTATSDATGDGSGVLGDIEGAGYAAAGTLGPADGRAFVAYLTGAGSDGEPVRDVSDSTGGFRSGVRFESCSWDWQDAMVGIQILSIGGGNARGVGSIEAPTPDTLTWTPPSGTTGAAATVADGDTVTLPGGNTGAWVRVRRNLDVPMEGAKAVTVMDIYNNLFPDVETADAVAGLVTARALYLRNEAGKIWLFRAWAGASDDTIAIALEVPTAGELLGSGLTWTTDATIVSVDADAGIGLHIRRTVAADTVPSASNEWAVNLSWSDGVTTYTTAIRGRYRVERTDYIKEGIWVATDAWPDFDAAPDETWTSRPHTTTTVGLTGPATARAAIRAMNAWGLWGIPSAVTDYPIDGSGDGTDVPPSGPSDLSANQTAGGLATVGALYDADADGDYRGQIWLIWQDRDGTTPDGSGTPDAYEVMPYRQAFADLAWIDRGGDALIDGAPLKALVRVRRLVPTAGDVFQPDVIQLDDSSTGSLKVDSELSGWGSSGYAAITSVPISGPVGKLGEVVSYSAVTIAAGQTTITVDGRGLWGTTAAETSASSYVTPITYIDSENTDVATWEAVAVGPGRPFGALLYGTQGAQAQAPVEGPDGTTPQVLDAGENVHILLGVGWASLYVDTTLVWRVLWQSDDGAAKLYVPSEWTLVPGAVSGAASGTVVDAVDSDTIYVVVNGIRKMLIDLDAMEITAASFNDEIDMPVRADQDGVLGQFGATLFLTWDPSIEDYRPFAQLTAAGAFNTAVVLDQSLNAAAVEALWPAS